MKVNEDIIEIRPPACTKNEGLTGINEKILQKSFISLIVGKPGSGKSHLLFEFLDNPALFNKKFDKVYFLSPSVISGIKMNESNWIKYFSPKWMLSKAMENSDDFEKMKHPCNILFVIDDMISAIKQNENDPILVDLFFNRRKIVPNCVISYFIVTQKYMVCPSKIRTNLTSVFFFKGNGVDLKKILEENCDDISRFQKTIIKNHLNNSRKFVYIRCDLGKIYLNFKELL